MVALACQINNNKKDSKENAWTKLDYCFSVKRQKYLVCIALITSTKQFFPHNHTIMRIGALQMFMENCVCNSHTYIVSPRMDFHGKVVFLLLNKSPNFNCLSFIAMPQ